MTRLRSYAPLKRESAKVRAGCIDCGASVTHGTRKGRCRPCFYKSRRAERLPCRICGKPARSAQGHYCSFACANVGRLKRKTMACEWCGADFYRRYSELRVGPRRYCSEKCMRAGRGTRPALIEVACAQCGKTFRRTLAAVKRVRTSYCSHVCASFSTRGGRHIFYRGRPDNRRGAKWEARAERIRVRDGHCCRRCGKMQAENGRRLSVDHIIPWLVFTDHEKDAANADDNLAALCTSCHSYKTMVAEHRWLKGDRYDFSGYLRALALPSAAGER